MFDEALAGAVHAQLRLLGLRLDRHEAHVRALQSFADRRSVGRVVLACLPDSRYGTTNFGAISRTVWPCCVNSLAQ